MADLDPEVLDHLRTICLALPEAYEEAAWIGTRWCVRSKTFAHVVHIDGHPPVYTRVVGPDPHTVLTFESAPPELDALRGSDPPFFAPPWRPTIVGLYLDGPVDWTEVAELLIESYCVHAPARLVALVDRPD